MAAVRLQKANAEYVQWASILSGPFRIKPPGTIFVVRLMEKVQSAFSKAMNYGVIRESQPPHRRTTIGNTFPSLKTSADFRYLSLQKPIVRPFSNLMAKCVSSAFSMSYPPTFQDGSSSEVVQHFHTKASKFVASSWDWTYVSRYKLYFQCRPLI